MNFFSNSRKRNMLGITSRATVDTIQWLRDFVWMEFPHLEVKYIPIYNGNSASWEEEVKKCSVIMLYHTPRLGRLNVTDVPGALYDNELRFLNIHLGREKVVVLLDDMEETGEEEKRRILKTQPSLNRLSSYLILIPKNKKNQAAQRKLAEFIAALPGSVKTSQKEGGIISRILLNFSSDSEYGDTSSRSSGAPHKPWSPPPTYHISIFSRSADSCYSWLTDILREKDDKTSVDVHPVYVSNKYEMFRSALRTCQFGILYHSQNQGRLNITDVPDSLYDRELQDMSSFLGKENVIVVVDDLESNISEAKERILKNQPSIQKLARDLFVFSEKEKYTSNLERIRKIIETNLSKLQTPHRAAERSRINHGSSVGSGRNQQQQKQLSTQDSQYSSSGSADYQSISLKRDDVGPQSKKSKTASQTMSKDNNGDLSMVIYQEEMSKKICDLEKRELQDKKEKLDKRQKKIQERDVEREERIRERYDDEREEMVRGRERNDDEQEERMRERVRYDNEREEMVRGRERNDDEQLQKILENLTILHTTTNDINTKINQLIDTQNVCMECKCKPQQDKRAQQKRGVSPKSSHMN